MKALTLRKKSGESEGKRRSDLACQFTDQDENSGIRAVLLPLALSSKLSACLKTFFKLHVYRERTRNVLDGSDMECLLCAQH